MDDFPVVKDPDPLSRPRLKDFPLKTIIVDQPSGILFLSASSCRSSPQTHPYKEWSRVKLTGRSVQLWLTYWTCPFFLHYLGRL